MRICPYRFVLLLCLIAFSVLLSPAQSALMRDKESMEMIDNALDLQYNFEFADGEALMRVIKKKYPDHPAYYFYMAMSYYAQNFPINSKSPHYNTYKSYLNLTLEKAGKMTALDADDFEGIFFSLSAQGYLALLYSEDGDYMKAGNVGTKAYGNMKKAMDMKEKFSEFWFFSGLYNYYIVNYPEQHPITKPIFFFFKSGNKLTGLKEIKIACRKAFFTKNEAHSFLASMYSKYENRFDSAAKYAGILAEKYPKNLNFAAKYAECLVMTGKYKTAKPYIEQLESAGGIYDAYAQCYTGMVLENAYDDFDKAETAYRKALSLCENAKQSTLNLESFCHAGLARCMRRRGLKDAARSHYKKVLEMTEYKHLTLEAKSYLRE